MTQWSLIVGVSTSIHLLASWHVPIILTSWKNNRSYEREKERERNHLFFHFEEKRVVYRFDSPSFAHGHAIRLALINFLSSFRIVRIKYNHPIGFPRVRKIRASKRHTFQHRNVRYNAAVVVCRIYFINTFFSYYAFSNEI